ncbi:cache domain-containing protein [Paucibacter sp. B2R-40]|uniref:cache domain-containing protein n=1 Tax=Paucibacter sp. B2R-40 TaxID=2893554 RepID=UPI0021E4039F|nr:cache domain-containing protein [Paucibacter sp. B2R-40]MCV2355827.1 cache domain-containing protein [Paucibacter sp. B2R-40]
MVIIQAPSPDSEDLELQGLAAAQRSHSRSQGLGHRTSMQLQRRPAMQRGLLLAYWVALPITLLIAFAWIWSCLQQLQEARDQAHARVKTLATVAAAGLQQQIGRDLPTLKALALNVSAQAASPARCLRFGADVSRLGSVLVNLVVRDLRGELVCELGSPTASMQKALSARANFRPTRQPIEGPQGRWLTWLTQPLFDDQGNRLGSLNLQLDLLQISERLRELLPSNAVVEVLSRQHTIVARSVDAAAFIGHVNALDGTLRGLHEGEFSAPWVAGEQPRLNYFVTISGTDWRLLAGLPQAELFADYEALLLRTLAQGLAFVLLLTWLSWRIGIGLMGPAMRRSRSAAWQD